MGPDALIFDVDGTLAETGELHRTSYNLAFRDLGVKWEWTPSLYARLPDKVSARDKLSYFVCHFLGQADTVLSAAAVLDHIATIKGNYFAQMIENGAAALRPGVARLIRDARHAGLPIAIASLSPRQDFEHLLQAHLGIEVLSQFKTVVTQETLPKGATRRDAYRAALAGLRMPADRVVAIDDADAGARAAKSVGLQVIATPGVYTASGKFDSADLVISDLGHPAAPFYVIKGDPGAHNFVTIDALREWSAEFARLAA